MLQLHVAESMYNVPSAVPMDACGDVHIMFSLLLLCGFSLQDWPSILPHALLMEVSYLDSHNAALQIDWID